MKYEKVYLMGMIDGYKCEKGYIEKHCYSVTPSGNYQCDYRVKVLEQAGRASVFDTLKEAKEALEKL